MSSSGPEMDREYSAQSLLSRAGSERNSRYRVDMGIYISSFAATIFIAGLVTVGVSLITLLVALAVMLQTCQTKSAGVLERQMVKTHDYEYCKILSQHIEMNHLGLDAFPAVCNEYTSQYVSEGHYARYLNITLRLVESYVNSMNPGEDGQDVVLMDADDFFAPEFLLAGQPFKQPYQLDCDDCDKDTMYLKLHSVHEVYMKLRVGGWSLILLSRKPERLRNMMVDELLSAGYDGWSSLIMRMDDETTHIDCQKYFGRRESMMPKQGHHRIVAAISSQWDILTGSCRGRQNFKLPNPIISQKLKDGVRNTKAEE